MAKAEAADTTDPLTVAADHMAESARDWMDMARTCLRKARAGEDASENLGRSVSAAWALAVRDSARTMTDAMQVVSHLATQVAAADAEGSAGTGGAERAEGDDPSR